MKDSDLWQDYGVPRRKMTEEERARLEEICLEYQAEPESVARRNAVMEAALPIALMAAEYAFRMVRDGMFGVISDPHDFVADVTQEIAKSALTWSPDCGASAKTYLGARAFGATKDIFRNKGPENWTRAYGLVANVVSHCQYVSRGCDDKQVAMIETIAGPPQPEPIFHDEIDRALECLNRQQREVFVRHSRGEQTLFEIGQAIGLSESRCSLILKKARAVIAENFGGCGHSGARRLRAKVSRLAAR